MKAYGFGDREHSKSRPTLLLLSSVIDMFIAFLTLMCGYTSSLKYNGMGPDNIDNIFPFSGAILLVYTRHDTRALSARPMDAICVALPYRLGTVSNDVAAQLRELRQRSIVPLPAGTTAAAARRSAPIGPQ